MNKLTLYYDLLSQPSRSLFIFLSTAKVPFESKEIRLGKGEHLKEEFKKINPMSQVPAITDGDFNLAESIAIVRYLCRERNDIADTWYPKESKAQAKVDEFLEYQHLGIRLHCGIYFRLMWLEPLVTQKAPKPELAETFRKNMVNSCNQFEKTWLKNKQFICGDQMTVADIFAASELEQPKLAGYDPREGRPALAAWMDRVRNETNPYYDTAHETLNRLAIKFKGKSPALVAKH